MGLFNKEPQFQQNPYYQQQQQGYAPPPPPNQAPPPPPPPPEPSHHKDCKALHFDPRQHLDLRMAAMEVVKKTNLIKINGLIGITAPFLTLAAMIFSTSAGYAVVFIASMVFAFNIYKASMEIKRLRTQYQF